MLRSKLPLAIALSAMFLSLSLGASDSSAAPAPAPAGPGPDQLAAQNNWLAASKDIDWAHPGYFDGRKGTDVLILAEKSPAATFVVCDDAPVGQFGMAKFTAQGGPAKKSFPMSGGAGGACYLFKDVTFLQLNAASDAPRWWGRYYASVPKKK